MEKISHGCTLDCFDCCKFNILIEDNKILKIQGDKDHPFTKGFICKKGLAHLDRLTHSERVYKPLLKVNGRFEEISFDKAIDIMAEKISLYKKEFTSKSILYYEQYGNGAILKSIGEVFTNFLGGCTKTDGGPCWSAGIKAQKLNFGEVKSHSIDDMLNSKTIFVWGKNPAFTSIHTNQSIRKAKQKGSFVVVIDPIKTKSAEMADKYVRIKPNGDGALALAMGKMMIDRNLIDKEYIKNYVNCFEEYKDYVENLSYETLTEASGVSLEEVEELVNLYNRKYSTILLGYGMQKYRNGGNTISLIDTLGAISGQIGCAGGGINYANKVFPKVINQDPYNSSEKAEDRIFYVSYMPEFINKSLEDNNEVPLKMAIITKSNMLNQLADLNSLKTAFSKIEFKVCFDMFLTDTAVECDLFIPTTSTLESEDIIYSSMTNPYIIYNEKAVEPREELMDEYYFFRELAKRLNILEYPMVDKREYLSKVIEPLKKYNENMSIEFIKDNYFTIHESVAWKDKVFDTESKRFEIFFKEDLYLQEKEVKKYEFRIITIHSRDSLSSQHIMDDTDMAEAYINEKMANEINIQDDSIVSLSNDKGEIKVRLKLDNIVSDNVIMMYAGWWKKHGNPNYVTESGISDIGGQITYNESIVKIKKRE